MAAIHPRLPGSPFSSTLEDARRRYADARPQSKALHDEARTLLPGGNTRTVLYHEPFPLRVEHADGAVIEDVDGHRYVDLLGNYSAGLFGHSEQAIAAAVTAALDRGVGPGMHSAAEVEMARAVCERFDAIEQVRFTNSGTEANLMALSAARAFTGRERVLALSGGYHGGVLTFPAGTGTSPVNAPYDVLLAPYNDLDAATRLLHENDVAAVLVEPMLGASGCVPGTKEFLQGLRAAATETGALLVVDEVMTSRNGPGGMQQLLGIRGDLTTLGKYLGGGFSFGAFGGRADVMALFDPAEPGALPHAGTFNNNLASMLAGHAGLTQVYTPEVAQRHTERGDRLRSELAGVLGGLPFQATGAGSLMAIHPTTAGVHRAEDVASCDPALRELLFLGLLERGYYIAPRGYMALSLAVTGEQLVGFLHALRGVASELGDLTG
jgi:glutamate-1-semialdehyde 2,1-aminomutase